jgi:hypothetical protein
MDMTMTMYRTLLVVALFAAFGTISYSTGKSAQTTAAATSNEKELATQVADLTEIKTLLERELHASHDVIRALRAKNQPAQPVLVPAAEAVTTATAQ